MNYFTVEFYYQGPFANFPDSTTHPEMQRLSAAESKAELGLVLNKIQFKHAYSWPDGSLYKYIRTELSEEEMLKKLKDIFNTPELGITKLYHEDSKEQTSSGDTLEQRFTAK